jgi:hypothetical protein
MNTYKDVSYLILHHNDNMFNSANTSVSPRGQQLALTITIHEQNQLELSLDVIHTNFSYHLFIILSNIDLSPRGSKGIPNLVCLYKVVFYQV